MSDRTVIVLSEKAQTFMNTPCKVAMPMVDGIYTIGAPKKWFVVYVSPKLETRVEAGLRAMGLEAYVPIGADWRKQSRREKHMQAKKVRIERPLLPRYVMVALPERNPDFGRLFTVEGVKQILGDFDRPVHLRTEIVEAIQARQAKGHFDETIKKGSIYIPKWATVGAKVTITDGPFATFVALIRKVLPNDIIRLDVDFLGKATPVDLEIAQVRTF